MRKFLIFVLSILFLLFAIVIALPFMFPADSYREVLQQQVKQNTGHELFIDGEFDISFLPSLELTAEKVRMVNKDATSEKHKNLLEADKIDFQVSIWSFLFDKEININRFVLEKPKLYIKLDDTGNPNYNLGVPKSSNQQESNSPEQKQNSNPEQSSRPVDVKLSLNNIEINDGHVTFYEAKSNNIREISSINSTISYPGDNTPFKFDGSFIYNKEKFDVTARIEDFISFQKGEESAIDFDVASKIINLSMENASMGYKPMKAGGDIKLEVPSIRELSAFAGKKLDHIKVDGLNEFEISGNLQYNKNKIMFSDAKLLLDGMQGDGSLLLRIAQSKPYIEASMNFDKLDFNKYIPQKKQTVANNTDKSQEKENLSEAPKEWSTEWVDFSRLYKAEGIFNLETEQILFGDIEIGKTVLGGELKNGDFTAKLSEMALYEGQGSSELMVDLENNIPTISLKANLQDINLGEFIKSTNDIDNFKGKGNLTAAIQTKGNSELAWMNNMSGDININTKDGELTGFDIPALLKDPIGFLKSQQQAQTTKIVGASADFNIEKGVANSDNITIDMEKLLVAGTATSNLADRNLKARLAPKKIKEVDGEKTAKSTFVPVIIEGPWHKLSYRPDVSDLVKRKLLDKEGYKETEDDIREFRDDVKDKFKKIF